MDTFINYLFWNDRRRDIFKQIARHDNLIIDRNGESVVGVHFQSEYVWLVVGELLLKLTVVSLFSWRAFSDFPRDRILVSEDKMQLVISATLVRAKHDSER